jgi:hypothetical protein
MAAELAKENVGSLATDPFGNPWELSLRNEYKKKSGRER